MEKLKDYIQEKLNDVFNKTPEEQNRVKHLISKMGDFYIRGTKVIDANLHAEWEKAIISSSELYCLKELEDALQIMEILYSGKNSEDIEKIFYKARKDDLSYDIVNSLILKFSSRAQEFKNLCTINNTTAI